MFNSFVSTSVPFERYDPTREEHSKFEMEKEEQTVKKISSEGIASSKTKHEEEEEVIKQQEEETTVVSTERFYQVDSSLKSLFGSSTQVLKVLRKY